MNSSSSSEQSSSEYNGNSVSAPIMGLIIGLLIDIGGSMLLSSMIYSAYSVYSIVNGIPHETVNSIKSIQEYLSKPHFVISSILGSFLSVLAGFVCSRIAQTKTMKLAYIMATISFIIAFALSYSTYPVMLIIILSAISYVLLIIGYAIGQRANKPR